MKPTTRRRETCPKCGLSGSRLEAKMGGGRLQPEQPKGGILQPGLLYFCRVHGAFTVPVAGAVPATPEQKAERRRLLTQALAIALREVETQ